MLATLALLCGGIVACHDDAMAPHTVPTPSGPMRDLGTVIVHVDMKRGIITTSAVGNDVAMPPGVSGRFFGNKTQIEYALSEQANTDLGNTDREYNIHAGLANLLTFAIGTNSPHTYPAFPQDTMGVYVYYAFLPYNITSTGGPCGPPTCTVTIDSADGTYPFTSGTPQPYVYWKSILEGGGTGASQPGPFETNQSGIGGSNYFRTMSFRTHGNVTDFSFGLSMAAAWVDPNESRWKVFYVADSLPDRVSLQDLRSEPDWRVFGTGGGTPTIQPANCTFGSGCQLQIVSTTASAAAETLMYYRSDSLRASQNGYISATMTATPSGPEPSIFLGLKDPVKLVQMGISTGNTGFTDSAGNLLVGHTVPTVSTRTTWRVAKYGTDSAAIFSPADSVAPVLRIPYATLPHAPGQGVGAQPYDRFFFFGNVTSPFVATDGTSLWSNVNYEIGAAAP